MREGKKNQLKYNRIVRFNFFVSCPDISLVSNNIYCKFIFTSKLTLLHCFLYGWYWIVLVCSYVSLTGTDTGGDTLCYNSWYSWGFGLWCLSSSALRRNKKRRGFTFVLILCYYRNWRHLFFYEMNFNFSYLLRMNFRHQGEQKRVFLSRKSAFSPDTKNMTPPTGLAC